MVCGNTHAQVCSTNVYGTSAHLDFLIPLERSSDTGNGSIVAISYRVWSSHRQLSSAGVLPVVDDRGILLVGTPKILTLVEGFIRYTFRVWRSLWRALLC